VIAAQNTSAVIATQAMTPAFIAEQVEAVVYDIGVDAIKVGLIPSAETAKVIAGILKKMALPTVIDPVFFATSGDRLAPIDLRLAYREFLFPLATVVTPNLPEAAILLGREISDQEAAAQELQELGSAAVVLKGGHRKDGADDCVVTADEVRWFRQERIATSNTHGTGCTFSAAIACALAQGDSPMEAVARAKLFVTGCLKAYAEEEIGAGPGPMQPLLYQETELC
jgi:hydroxymethylpyrimidine/phosphomethylpyrimidine kinase